MFCQMFNLCDVQCRVQSMFVYVNEREEILGPFEDQDVG